MRPELPVPGSPEDWLRHARSDLALAGYRDTAGVILETLSFHTQQAAEKSIKAVLTQNGIPFPYTQDLARLVTLVKNAGISWPEDLDDVTQLTAYATVTRYPGPPNEVTDDKYRRAVEIAARVLEWAENSLR